MLEWELIMDGLYHLLLIPLNWVNQRRNRFCDALALHDTAEQVLGDDILKNIVRELTKVIKENMSID